MQNLKNKALKEKIIYFFDKEWFLFFKSLVSFLIFIFLIDFSWRSTHMVFFDYSFTRLVFSMSATLLGLYLLSVIIASVLKWIYIGVFTFSGTKGCNWFYFALVSLLYIFFFSVLATVAFRGFNLVVIVNHWHYHFFILGVILFGFIFILLKSNKMNMAFYLKRIQLTGGVVKIVFFGSFFMFLLLAILNFSNSNKQISLIDRTKKNVILITIDALNREHTSLLSGNSRIITPNLSLFAKQAYDFSHMHHTKTGTVRNMTSLFFSKRKWQDESSSVNLWGDSFSQEEHLASYLRKYGYSSYAIFPLGLERISPHKLLLPFNKEFARCLVFPNNYFNILYLYDYFVYKIFGSGSYLSSLISDYSFNRVTFLLNFIAPAVAHDAKVVERTKAFLKDKKEPYFLWVHFLSPHDFRKTIPPSDFRRCSQDYNDKVANYIGLISYVDYQFGKLIALLKRQEYYTNSLIIVTADHGTGLDYKPVYSEMALNIPLLIHFPGQEKSGKIRSLADHTDIVPTICQTIGIPSPAWGDGESLLRDLNGRGRKSLKVKYFSDIFGNNVAYWRNFKLIKRLDSTNSQLYNFVKDRDEVHDLSLKRSGIKSKLIKKINSEFNL